jgi:hypothetical protein
MLHHADNKLVTKTFVNLGGGNVEMVLRPERNPVHIHIAETPKMLRINRQVFRDWMQNKNYPSAAIIRQMEHDWGAKSARYTLGGGTQWASGQLWAVEIPLTAANNLESHLPSNNRAVPVSAQAPKRPSPAAALAGNQPKI